MRVQPRPLITVGLTIGYMAIVALAWVVLDLDYDTVGDTTANVVQGIVVPVALGGAFLAVATTRLGWWRPAIHEESAAPGWLWAAPALMLLPGLGAVLGGWQTADRTAGFLLALATGTLLVGFSEELLTRGTGLVGLRGGFGEASSWFFSCLIFGLIHALNALFGQAIGTTLQQIGFAFVAGSLLYVTRRVSGTLIACILLHAWIDFTTFGFSDAAVDVESPFVALSLAQWGALLLALVGVVVLLRRQSEPEQTTSDELAPA